MHHDLYQEAEGLLSAEIIIIVLQKNQSVFRLWVETCMMFGINSDLYSSLSTEDCEVEQMFKAWVAREFAGT